MATLLVPESYADINTAVAAASNGDTISIADGTYTEYIYNTKQLTYTGRTTDPTGVVITNGANAYTMVIGTGSVVTGVTVNYTGGVGAARYAIVGMSFTAVITVVNVHINTNASGIGPSGWGTTIDRCKIVCTYKDVGYATYGIYQTASGSGTPTSVGSTLVLDFNHAQIYAENITVVNSVTYTSYVRNASIRGMYATHLFNCIAVLDGPNGYSGIGVANGGSSTNCLAFGWDGSSYGDYTFGSGTTNTNNLRGTDVTASGQPVFIDSANDDFRVAPAGVAYHSGSYTFQSTYNAFLNDLAGTAFDDPPSRGAYEHVASGGGTTTNARCRLGLKLGI
ncbi:MAG: hypothetical protein Unbinned5179contig1001_32 [Prokaryotic dsDNA virus sp.]|nr:MAG: hypothetical protein Unbinned5179contig1001_32 [Prokaryotic dsDNA virus sp.]|tara:strand:+ start:8587 stop:9597 length:1011 start_codon:yes stop_codon:yes gene_type:complete